MADEKQQSIGGVWVKKPKSGGDKYLYVEVEMDGKKVGVVGFKNTFKKEGENTPDYRLFPQKKMGDKPAPKPAPKAAPAPVEEDVLV